ncbi:MAG: molybdopterin converting factor subunit 1 [Candidatus Wallbacteria bacterium]|nr:molybdopterin converting factor subunit 1 [Candidatus Wallbacteria bacterium]
MGSVQVKLFAVLRDRFGAESVEAELPPGGTTAGRLLAELSRRYPDQARHLSVCRVAVNRRFAVEDDPVGATDEVALIPPVSGG